MKNETREFHINCSIITIMSTPPPFPFQAFPTTLFHKYCKNVGASRNNELKLEIRALGWFFTLFLHHPPPQSRRKSSKFARCCIYLKKRYFKWAKKRGGGGKKCPKENIMYPGNYLMGSSQMLFDIIILLITEITHSLLFSQH